MVESAIITRQVWLHSGGSPNGYNLARIKRSGELARVFDQYAGFVIDFERYDHHDFSKSTTDATDALSPSVEAVDLSGEYRFSRFDGVLFYLRYPAFDSSGGHDCGGGSLVIAVDQAQPDGLGYSILRRFGRAPVSGLDGAAALVSRVKETAERNGYLICFKIGSRSQSRHDSDSEFLHPPSMFLSLSIAIAAEFRQVDVTRHAEVVGSIDAAITDYVLNTRTPTK